MPVTRNPQFSFSLADVVKTALGSLSEARVLIRQKSEDEFQRTVNTGISYEAQLAYRQAQLAKEQSSAVPDQSYVEELKNDIALAEKLSRQEKYRKEFNDNITELKLGHETWQQHIEFLQQMRTRYGQDPAIAEKLDTAMTDAVTGKRSYEDTAMDNFAQFAQNERSPQLLEEAIAKYETQRTLAQTSNDPNRMAYYAAKISGLKSDRSRIMVENARSAFNVRKIKSVDPVAALDMYDEYRGSADDGAPVTIDGTRYDSAKQYWDSAKADYINGGQFYTSLQNQLKGKIDASFAQSPELFDKSIAAFKSSLDAMMGRPDLAPYREQIATNVANIMDYATGKLAKFYVDQASAMPEEGVAMEAARRLKELEKTSGISQSIGILAIADAVSNADPALAGRVWSLATGQAPAAGPYQSPVLPSTTTLPPVPSTTTLPPLTKDASLTTRTPGIDVPPTGFVAPNEGESFKVGGRTYKIVNNEPVEQMTQTTTLPPTTTTLPPTTTTMPPTTTTLPNTPRPTPTPAPKKSSVTTPASTIA